MPSTITMSRVDEPPKVCLLAWGGLWGHMCLSGWWLFQCTPARIHVRKHVIRLPTNLATRSTNILLTRMKCTVGTSMGLYFF